MCRAAHQRDLLGKCTVTAGTDLRLAATSACGLASFPDTKEDSGTHAHLSPYQATKISSHEPNKENNRKRDFAGEAQQYASEFLVAVDKAGGKYYAPSHVEAAKRIAKL